MGSLTNYVTITITRNSVGITRAGFGTMLILTPNVAWSTKTRSYSDLAGVAVDFSDTTSFEYRAANAAFAQSPAPTKIKFGKLVNKPTMISQVSVVTVRNSYTYQLCVKGKGVTDTTVSYTSDGTATDAEIAAGFVTALNLVVGKNFTATGASSPISITGTAAGDWFSIEVVNPDDLKVSMTHADPGVAADLNAIKLADSDFYAVYNAYNSSGMALAIAAWAEANTRIFVLDTNETNAIITAVSSGDTVDQVKTAAYKNTLAMYHHRRDQMAGAALLGAVLPLDPGTETWADKNLAGVDPTNLSQTHRDNLVAKHANGYESVAGIGITFNGMVGSGDYLDTTRFLHWFQDDAQKGIFGLKVNNPKIPLSNPGIAKVVTELRRSLSKGEARTGFLPGWTVTFPDEADISPADRAVRTLNGIKGSAQLQGAAQIINVGINVIA